MLKNQERKRVFFPGPKEKDKKGKEKNNHHLRPIQIDHKELDEALTPLQSKTKTTLATKVEEKPVYYTETQ